jgi:hypothetical protein
MSVDIIVNKFVEHLPLFRLERRNRPAHTVRCGRGIREAGLDR